jgi:hypothetical protein
VRLAFVGKTRALSRIKIASEQQGAKPLLRGFFLSHNRKLRQCKPLQGEFAKANSLKNVLAGARFFAALEEV